jgi:CheY-like chemotaxis protein
MKKTILVVDDEKDIIDLLNYNLCKEGFAVITARNGKEALEKVRQKPDLIILDVMMPEMSGLQVIQELKKNKNTASASSPANPVTTLTDPTKDTPAEKPHQVIEFKTDSTTSPGSENSPGDGNTNSGTVSNANAPSTPITSESLPVAEKKDTKNNVSPISTDSTSNSKSPAIGGGSASLKKPDTTASIKAQKLQEIRYQKTANQNRLAENAKKRAARSRG